jgi:hypothetical protein
LISGGWDDSRRDSFFGDSLGTDIRVSAKASFNGDKCTGSSAGEMGARVEISKVGIVARTSWVAGSIEFALFQPLAKTYII